MDELRQLEPQDVIFIGAESANVYQHTAGLMVLDGSTDPGFGFDAFRRHMEQRLGAIPHFRWKLHEVPLGLDLPYWVADEHFSFDRHIRRIAVPAPGDDKALAETTAHLYSRHLDRDRPLWEVWFIEGLAKGRFAVVQKLHHCMMDGAGIAKLTQSTWDLEPGAPPPPVERAVAEAKPGAVPALWQQSLNAAMHLYGMPVKMGREAFEAVWRSAWKRLSGSDESRRNPSAPGTIFNADISADRGFVFGSLPFSDVKTVKDRFGVTVNDVILAVTGASLRDYLRARGALPAESLRTSVPVSLRTDADDEFSNRVTTTTVTLATDLSDPVERLRAIAAESEKAKAQARSGNKNVMEFMQLLPPVLVNAAMSLTPAEQIPQLAGVNVVVSNVRGSPKPMYIAGARVLAAYPMSILMRGGGINITCVSYAGNIDFGVTIEPNLVPEPWRIIEGLHASLREYLRAAGKGAARAKPAPGKSRASASPRTAARKKAAPKGRPSGRKTPR